MKQPTELVIKIEGMHCGGCVKRVENVLKGFKEIKKASVSLEEAQAVIELKKELAAEKIVEAINDLGFKASL